MNPKTIWKIDKLAGTPACALLTPFAALGRLFRKDSNHKPKRILFVKLIEMGSTVLACPAFDEAVRMVGRENIFFMAFEPNRPIVDVLPFFPPENIITIDDSNLFSFAAGLIRAMIRIRSENIDTAIDMEGLTRSSAIITYLTGATCRVGYHNFTSEGPYRGRLFTRELNYNFQHHVSRMFLALVKSLESSSADIPHLKEKISTDDFHMPEFSPSDREIEEVRAILKKLGASPGGRTVLLNANCSDLLPLRRWPTENFINLGKLIIKERSDVTIIITGAPSEQKEADAIAMAISQGNRAVCVAGHTTLRQLLTLYCMSDLLISNDSGPCHFASLTPINVLALFGPETPQLYSPLGGKARNICAGLACSPCVNMLNHRFSPCRDNKCMKSISLDEVYREVVNILDQNNKK